MPMNRFRRFVRRLAPAVASAQLLAFAFAPVFEGITAGPQQNTELAVGPVGSSPAAPFHDVETCLACQVMNTLALLPTAEAPTLPSTTVADNDWLTLAVPQDGIQRQGFYSRAPPVLPS
jgi:hypothetical protein